ncbi:hypothetical protein F5Y16DRAFT_423533 [Xylariaceae sp. FL0255]|nr:hypothetical protein F5Y16DRAFT_423533 [Xylariaceae sp. FL0255]
MSDLTTSLSASHPIAQLIVQRISSTGSCVINLPAEAAALDTCSSIEIRIRNDDVVDLHPDDDTICITPTQPDPNYSTSSSSTAQIEQTAYPSLPPWWPGIPGRGDGPPAADAPVTSTTVTVPVITTKTASVSAYPLPSGYDTSPPTDPYPTVPIGNNGGDGGDGSDGERERDEYPTSPYPVISPYPSTSDMVTAPESPLPEPADPYTEGPGYPLVSASPSTIDPYAEGPSYPFYSSSPSATDPYTEGPGYPYVSASPSPTPGLPTFLPPAGNGPVPVATYNPIPLPGRPSSAPSPSPMNTVPSFCESSYTSIDVSQISGINQNTYDSYLNLLGLGSLVEGLLGGLLGGGGGNAQSSTEAHSKLVHKYRVLCGVGMPQGSGPTFPGFGGQEHDITVQGGHESCLAECERTAIEQADQGILSECLGIAYQASVEGDDDGEGQCRLWCGDEDEHEFLPVDSLPRDDTSDGSNNSQGGRWQVVYM